jgi:hypothetical protein
MIANPAVAPTSTRPPHLQAATELGSGMAIGRAQVVAGQRVASLDREVHRGMKGIGCALIMVSVLGCLGFCLLLVGIINQPGPYTILPGIISGTLLAVTLYMGNVLLSPRRSPKVVGALHLSGIAAIGCLALVATCIVLFFSCAEALFSDAGK